MAAVRKAILVAAACPSPRFFTPLSSVQNDRNIIMSLLTANFVLGQAFWVAGGSPEKPELAAGKTLQGEKRLGFREKILKIRGKNITL